MLTRWCWRAAAAGDLAGRAWRRRIAPRKWRSAASATASEACAPSLGGPPTWHKKDAALSKQKEASAPETQAGGRTQVWRQEKSNRWKGRGAGVVYMYSLDPQDLSCKHHDFPTLQVLPTRRGSRHRRRQSCEERAGARGRLRRCHEPAFRPRAAAGRWLMRPGGLDGRRPHGHARYAPALARPSRYP